jgi:hypothetical protein
VKSVVPIPSDSSSPKPTPRVPLSKSPAVSRGDYGQSTRDRSRPEVVVQSRSAEPHGVDLSVLPGLLPFTNETRFSKVLALSPLPGPVQQERPSKPRLPTLPILSPLPSLPAKQGRIGAPAGAIPLMRLRVPAVGSFRREFSSEGIVNPTQPTEPEVQ